MCLLPDEKLKISGEAKDSLALKKSSLE